MPVVERMRPLLGTFVTIRTEPTPSLSHDQIEDVIGSAFRTIERVERLMSFHRADSDVGRLNRSGPGRVVPIDRWTRAVIAESLDLWRDSDGAFDCNVGAHLVRAGLLPRLRRDALRKLRPLGESISLTAAGVRVHRRVCLDLGGIAKGFAVDQAVQVLRRHGVAGGLVNAGGDLRTFGPTPYPLWVRRADSPSERMLLGRIRDGAVATSASYFVSDTSTDGISASAIVDAARGQRVALSGSVSVIAKTCMRADALTKIVALRDKLSHALRTKSQATVIRT